MDECCSAKTCEVQALAARADLRNVLIAVFAINAAMFVVEFTAGLVANSSALQADSIDMLGDSLVYALSLFALRRSSRWQAGAAVVKGFVILGFFVFVVAEIAFKLRNGVTPSSRLMLIFGGIALIANVVCLRLLWRFRTLNINLRSTFECSRNDVVANVGVLAAAAGVALVGSEWPDIVVGAVIAAMFLRSATSVLREAWPQFRRAT